MSGELNLFPTGYLNKLSLNLDDKNEISLLSINSDNNISYYNSILLYNNNINYLCIEESVNLNNNLYFENYIIYSHVIHDGIIKKIDNKVILFNVNDLSFYNGGNITIKIKSMINEYGLPGLFLN